MEVGVKGCVPMASPTPTFHSGRAMSERTGAVRQVCLDTEVTGAVRQVWTWRWTEADVESRIRLYG